MSYRYHVLYDPPAYPREEPIAVFRQDESGVVEVLKRDGQWHFDGEAMRRVLLGDVDISEIDEGLARQIVTRRGGVA